VYVSAVHPADDQTLLLGGYEGIVRTTDGGASFGPIRDNSSTRFLAFSTSSPNVVYSAGDHDAVLRSSDAGITWAQSQALPTRAIYGMAVHPTDPNTLLVGFSEAVSWTPRIYRTSDGGASWTAANVTAAPISYSFSFLDFDPVNPSNAYAATPEKLYKSVDGGLNWVPLLAPFLVPRNQMQSMRAFGGAGAGIYITSFYGIHSSTDGGGSWARKPASSPYVYPDFVEADPGDTSKLFVLQGWELWRSTDGGSNFSFMATGINIDEIRVAPSNSLTLYSHGPMGVHRSADGGSSWSAIGTASYSFR
jgi:photosystem II stability/assembly factor-like uncharacterized protein